MVLLRTAPGVGSVRLCGAHHLSLRIQKVGALVGAGLTVQQIFQAHTGSAVPTSVFRA